MFEPIGRAVERGCAVSISIFMYTVGRPEKLAKIRALRAQVIPFTNQRDNLRPLLKQTQRAG
jgi:hypothetical protein